MYGKDQHLVNHIFHSKLRNDNNLHVIGVVSNPVRYHSRYRLAREWIEKMANTDNVNLTVVEAAFGDREHEIVNDTQNSKFDKIEVRIRSNAWIKESMINLAFRHITSRFPHANYFAWVDMDVFFESQDWAQETLQKLQTFEVVQPWSEALDLGPNGNILETFRSFGSQNKGLFLKKQARPPYYPYAHTGFAWAATRNFIEATWGAGGSNGPLMDWAILGSADNHMAFAMVGKTLSTINKMIYPSFSRKCVEWQNKAVTVTNNQVSFIPGFIKHKFHGPKNRRYYRERWKILVDNQYDPDTQLIHDGQGIAVLTGNHQLEAAIYDYNLSRFEDSIEEN